MNSITTMTLVIVLISMVIGTLTSTAPITYSAYGRRQIAEKPEVLLWVDQTVPNLENAIFESAANPASTVTRTKRLGSLSIVNSLDVLRQRVLLELARRKALQDQRQIDANRRFLDSIGKRSVPTYGGSGRTRGGLEYAIEQQSNDRGLASERIPGRTQDWYEGDDPVFREPDEQIQPNEIRLL